MHADQLPDFVLPLRVVEQRYRVVYEPEAVVMEETLTKPSSEYRMRIRVALRALWALRDNPRLLNPMRSGIYAWQLVSHKLLRYISFAFLGSAAILAWFLAIQETVYRWAVGAELLFASMVLIGYVGPRSLATRALPRYCLFPLVESGMRGCIFRFIRGESRWYSNLAQVEHCRPHQAPLHSGRVPRSACGHGESVLAPATKSIARK
jgi:hypothetical protein